MRPTALYADAEEAAELYAADVAGGQGAAVGAAAQAAAAALTLPAGAKTAARPRALPTSPPPATTPTGGPDLLAGLQALQRIEGHQGMAEARATRRDLRAAG